MGSRPVHGPDREVIEGCRDRGYEVTARQLERWRPLLPDRIVVHEEGLRGSRSVNPPGYIGQAIAIAETLQSGIPLREVPLALFLQGLPVKTEVLRAAYLDILARLRREMETFNARAGSGEREPADQIDAVAAHMAARARRSSTGRRWEARARQAIRQRQIQADSVQALLSGVLSAALTGPFTGTAATPEGIGEMLIVLGLNDGQDPRHLASHLAVMNLETITHAVETATLDQWIAARGDLVQMQRYVELRRRVEARSAPAELRLAGLDDFFSQDLISRAAQVPALLITGTSQWRENLRSELARWEAVDSLLSAVPDEYHRPLLLNELPDEAAQDLRPRAEAWARQHPREAATLNISVNGET
jgi:hypothetical protein